MKLYRFVQKFKFQSQKGFSLVETLVVTGILSTVSLGSVGVITSLNKSVKSVEVQNEMISLQLEVSTMLATGTVCMDNILNKFGGVNVGSLASETATSLKNASGNDVFVAGTSLGVTQVSIEKFTFQDHADDPNGLWLVIHFDNKVSSIVKTKKVKIKYTVDGSNNIDTCYAAAGGATTPWIPNGANIFFNTGNVGIMNANPVYPLDVNGPIRIQNTVNACSAANAGLIRFNSSSGTLANRRIEYCNGGTSWTPLYQLKTANDFIQACGPHKYATGYDSSGSILCSDIPNCASNSRLHYNSSTQTITCQKIIPPDQTCPGSQVLKGFDSNGNKNCVSPPSISGVCGTGALSKGYNSSGSVVCESPRVLIQSCTTSGHSGCRVGCPSGYLLTGCTFALSMSHVDTRSNSCVARAAGLEDSNMAWAFCHRNY